MAAQQHRGIWGLVAALILASPAQAAPVLLILSEDGAPYREAAAAVRSQVGIVRELTLAQAERELANAGVPPGTKLIVTLGVRAARHFSATSALPLLCTLIPRRSFEALQRGADLARGPPRLSAVFLDQPAGQQVALVNLVLHGGRRVGLLVSADANSAADELRNAAQALNVSLEVERLQSEAQFAVALERLLQRSDALLMLPDAIASKPDNGQTLLLASYRAQVPVIAFSQAYVRAGAVAAVYSTPTQLGTQAGAMAAAYLRDPTRLAMPAYPTDFEVGVNTRVARSFGLRLDDADSLRRRLRAMEQEP